MFFLTKKLKISIEPHRRECVVHFQKPLLEKIASELKKRGKHKYAFVTDKNTYALYGEKLQILLKKSEVESEFFVITGGEKSKSLKTVESLATQMLEKGITRSETMVGLGGGMVGDLAGFVSSIYMRGMPLIQIPTTLLSMVDAAIGGKTAVNLEMGKNLLGTFHQPRAIFINPFFLTSLPQEQLMSGLAEVIKYGVIRDKKLFKILEHKKDEILSLHPDILNTILVRSIRIKLEIIGKDERESGLRMVLNYGHTVGHALEKLSNFNLTHGQAISIGMVEENKWAVTEGILKAKHADRIRKLLENYELPTQVPKNIKATEIRKTMQFDKKKRGKILYVAIPKKIGKAIVVQYE
ncbi:MAG: 3-dehydroquinate synthase [Patescibacteria group bacterium]